MSGFYRHQLTTFCFCFPVGEGGGEKTVTASSEAAATGGIARISQRHSNMLLTAEFLANETYQG